MAAGDSKGRDDAAGPPSGAPGEEPVDAESTAALAADLRAAVSGEVRFDEYARVLYATDGSIYRARPAGVVCPVDAADVRAAVRVAADHDAPVLPRGGGSSLAGQAVGPDCVVLDLSRHMDDILSIDPEGRRATVQPGVVQDDLDDRLAEFGLKFAPDPASSNRATVGGGIGNNSTGAHSVRYGITDAYTAELAVVLADGSLVRTREVVLDSPEWEEIVGKEDPEARIHRAVRELVEGHGEEIEERYPTLKRSVSGYNLNKVVYETESGDRAMNLSKLIVGAEGTLGVVVEATLDLVTKPAETALAVYCYDDLVAALAAVPVALDHDASAVELMDEEVFRLAGESSEFARYVEPIPDGTAAALVLEFDSELVSDFEEAIAGTTADLLDDGAAFEVVEAHAPDAQADLWKLRKAAIPLLMSLAGDPKPYPFVEDASVPPAELAEYVRGFEAILERHGTGAAYFAHAGSGTLHVRPILNLKEDEGVETMRAIAEDVTDLVAEHHGSFSGEHGDGLARTEFNPKLYGPDLWQAFKDLKSAFDPDWRMNPGKVVYRDETDVADESELRPGEPADMREFLRYGPGYDAIEPTTALDFEEEGGFAHLVELCNGCGTCRQTGGDVMCPTYRASREEIQTTRGRANLLRAAISGELPEDEMYSERFQSEVLDLCVGCKGCKSDCPTGVDLAKLKAEVKHQYHREQGADLRSRLFANVDRLAALGSALAPLSNWATRIPGVRTVGEKALGLAADRELPTFRRRTLVDWFEARGGSRIPEAEAAERVLLFPDTFTNYSYPSPGRAAVRLLEAANVHVRIPEGVGPSGRAAYSGGFLDLARERAGRNVAALQPLVAEGRSVLFVEPSDAVMFQDEYGDLLCEARSASTTASGQRPRASGEAALEIGAATYGVCEYLDVHGIDDRLDLDGGNRRLAYHGHCNQKALGKDRHAAAVLRRANYAVDELDSTCCGMAGSFGYEAEHYDLSQAIGRILFEQVEESGGVPVAPGASCRTQLGDCEDGERPAHPVEMVAGALVE